ncbi:hypothetical protein FHS31_002831 [Sphingomonas vulcanisoli]|uniref:Uncharacterized protein n=1 Tax=Sphingomonas vulcanisoli TaxID=1658060 RepID=A0ABX0TYC1_9SPHN|nr:hypothetical protein [Sphingomonas vulcanisoli]NIJ09199.1 hypothetical protein [Sphingomonas vulcanisoli]
MVRFAYLVLIAGAATAAAQTIQKPAPDIVVEGQKEAADIARFTANPRLPGAFQLEAQRNMSQAQIFTKCAKPDAATLRTILEGPPNDAHTISAQGDFVERHITCHLLYAGAGGETSLGPTIQGRMIGSSATDLNSSGNTSDQRIGVENTVHPDRQELARGLQGLYDRGALRDYAIATYAPDISLTKSQTHDDAVVSRFMAIEQGRNRFRDSTDLDYFKTAVCMVHAEPGIASRIAHTKPNSAESNSLGYTLLSRARGCVPGAKRIQVEPNQFRIYVVEALYRWVEAARGVDSLIPSVWEE